jgi:hypothetical protein
MIHVALASGSRLGNERGEPVRRSGFGEAPFMNFFGANQTVGGNGSIKTTKKERTILRM